MMKCGNDQKKNEYFEIEMNNGEMIRVTKVKNSWNGTGYGVRIQIREVDGHLRMGPEIPSLNLEETIKALKEFST